MKLKGNLLILFFFLLLNGYGQYLPNPSFEGAFPNVNTPPAPWQNCAGSPDTQPYAWDVPTPPSDGVSYLGFCWFDGYIEKVWSNLAEPLSGDTCYLFEIDLAFYSEINWNGTIENCYPIKMQIFNSPSNCSQTNLLWESPFISNQEWQTYDFTIEATGDDITNLLLSTYSNDPMPLPWPEHIGYILVDNIKITPPPPLDLGNDTTLCPPDTLFLNAGSEFTTFLWQDDSNDSVFAVTEPGIYWVEATTEWGCPVIDSIIVDTFSGTELGNDTIICFGDTLNLNAGSGYETYLWQDDSTDSTFSIFEPGEYWIWVTVGIGSCSATDSIFVLIDEVPNLHPLGNDTTLCNNDTLYLYAGPGFATFLWNDDSVDSVYMVTGEGTYWVEATTENGCTVFDTINVDQFSFVDLGSDTTICIGDTIIYDAGIGFDNYLWFDGTTESFCQLWEPGEYWVWVEVSDNSGCSDIDSVFLVIEDLGSNVSIGNDTTLCFGEELILDPGSFNSYTWQDGSNSQNFIVTTAGMYWVNVIGECGSGADTIIVNYFPETTVDLGADTSICHNESLSLDAGFGYLQYLWQDGYNQQIYHVYESGAYSVTVIDINGCENGDAIYVEVANVVNLGNDTSICEGDEIQLILNDDFDFVLWNTGSNNNFLDVSESGSYWVDVQYAFGCPSSDTVNIDFKPLPVANITGDDEICTGDSILISTIDGDFIYFWNNMEGNYNYWVNSGGEYKLRVENQCGETNDSIHITEFPNPEVDLGTNILLLPGESAELNAGSDFTSYLWQDGSTNTSYIVYFENTIDNENYFVEVFDGHCKNSDSIRVEAFIVKVPNVITPNGDGANDTFLPKGDWSGIKEHKMMVYNRWGEKVWESSDFPSGWNGKTNGKLVADGTYFWVFTLTYGSENLTQTLKGSLTVIR